MIAIIGAMPEEVRALQEEIQDAQVTERAGRRYVSGRLAGCEVVVTVSGVGKVNAAACTQQVIDLFAPEAVINTGVAGGLAGGLSLGDIVISTDAVQHDVDTTVFGDAPGQIPDMDVLAFPADAGLIEAAVAAGTEAEKNSSFKGNVCRGRVVSGDVFLTDKVKKEALRETFDGTCVEMEGAAVAQTAYLNQIPWVIIRCISDQADNPEVEAYLAFKKEAIRMSVCIVRGMLERLSSK